MDYWVNRLIYLLASQAKLAWLLVNVINLIIFGLRDGFPGMYGMLKIWAVGFVFGLAYLVARRNLLPLIYPHALIDSIDFITHFFG